MPADDTNTDAIAVRDPVEVIGQVLPITLFQGQMLTKSLLNTTAGGGTTGFSILDPGQTVAPDSVAWRAVAITVPDDRAVGGLITAGMSVDVLLSAQINVPQDLLTAGKYYTDKATKITYQNMLVLAKTGSGYVVKVTLEQAEEITHLVATGNAQFSMIMRPPADVRFADASKLGETTNLIIQRYGLPIPQNYPPGRDPVAGGPGRVGRARSERRPVTSGPDLGPMGSRSSPSDLGGRRGGSPTLTFLTVSGTGHPLRSMPSRR